MAALFAALLLTPLAALPATAAPAAASFVPANGTAGLMADLQRAAPGLNAGVLARAVAAAACAVDGGVRVKKPVLSVIDYSLPSTAKRLWVFDLAKRELLHHGLVAHGVGSGANYARTFSNTPDSRQTSLGLFRTAETYYGKNGYSLRLDGLERGINHLARPRTIVIHGAWYANPEFIRKQGRLGRSWGCPALPEAEARPVIDRIKGGSLVYADHGNDETLLASSYLACGGAPRVTTAATAR